MVSSLVTKLLFGKFSNHQGTLEIRKTNAKKCEAKKIGTIQTIQAIGWHVGKRKINSLKYNDEHVNWSDNDEESEFWDLEHNYKSGD